MNRIVLNCSFSFPAILMSFFFLFQIWNPSLGICIWSIVCIQNCYITVKGEWDSWVFAIYTTKFKNLAGTARTSFKYRTDWKEFWWKNLCNLCYKELEWRTDLSGGEWKEPRILRGSLMDNLSHPDSNACVLLA